MEIRFIDLFAGIGGIRKGLELASEECGIETLCVFASEIKPHAISVLEQNYPGEKVEGDITKIDVRDIPDFNILCAGFPCQAFSAAGNRKGFADTRGTLFFEIERILKAKKPQGFILENVEGLTNHRGGETLRTILSHLEDIGYKVSYSVLNSRYFGVPQERKRIYIVGTFTARVNLDNFPVVEKTLGSILDYGCPTMNNPISRLLLSKYSIPELYGKSIKDKRGGDNNIHSWDLCLKGEISDEEKELLNNILTERRKKKWAVEYGIDWMDGMPLTLEMIRSFYSAENLDGLLESLTGKGYLSFEHPKRKVVYNDNGNIVSSRVADPCLPKGYNIVTGKLSFGINKILDPDSVAPTLVATDMQRLAVVDGNGLRSLTLREGLRLFGYPDDFHFDNIAENEGFDLLGNTVVVPVIKAITLRLFKAIQL